jgi:hypothetical protein
MKGGCHFLSKKIEILQEESMRETYNKRFIKYGPVVSEMLFT